MPQGSILGLMAPNVKLASARRREGLSQDALAFRIQQVGYRLGHPNECNRANVARWESGGQPQPHYVKILEATLGQPAAELGLAYVAHGMDRDQILAQSGLDTDALLPELSAGYKYGPLSGVWLSRYEIYSSSRDDNFAYRHYVLVLQRGAYLSVRSLPGQHSRLALDLSVNGKMIRGTWAEHTSEGGYYRGSLYDGSIMLELNGANTRMKGRWLGFGRDPGEINDGPWQLTLVDGRVDPAAREKWDTPPEEGSTGHDS
jgi:transcriptional regulator with XRE-family HTH domain